jgi:hypothetical protein
MGNMFSFSLFFALFEHGETEEPGQAALFEFIDEVFSPVAPDSYRVG